MNGVRHYALAGLYFASMMRLRRVGLVRHGGGLRVWLMGRKDPEKLAHQQFCALIAS